MTILGKIKSTINDISEKTHKIRKDLRKQKEQELKSIESLDKAIKTKPKKSEYFDIRSSFWFWIVWAIVVYLAYVMFQSLELIYLILTAYILSVAMEAIVDIFAWRFGRWISIVISYILILAFIISWFLLIVPFILSQTADIVGMLIDKVEKFHLMLQNKWILSIVQDAWWIPKAVKGMLEWYLANEELMAWIQKSIQENISQILSYWSSYVKDAGSIAVTIITWFFAAIVKVFLVFIMAVFFSLEKDRVLWTLASLAWNRVVFRVKLEKLYRKLWFWLKWQLLLSVFIWVTVWILLHTLWMISDIDLPNKFTLALIAWITEFVPILWPILWAIPAILVAITTYWFTGLIVVWLMYYIVQWFENNVLVPIVMNKALWISPLLIFIAMLIWGSVLWFVWIVLSVPLAVIVTLAFEDFVNKDDN